MKEIPICKDQVLQLKIESLGRKGDGVGKYKDFVIVVPNTELDKVYSVRITDIHETYAFGMVIEEE